MIFTVLFILLILFSIFLTWYLNSKEKFTLDLKYLEVISGLFLGGKLSEENYHNKRTKIVEGFNILQRYWFNKMKK